MKRSRPSAQPDAPRGGPKRAGPPPPAAAAASGSEDARGDMSLGVPVYRSLRAASPPAVPAFGAPLVAATPSCAALARASAQSPVRMVTERDLLKRILRRKFDQTFDHAEQTPERWCSWIDQRWSALSQKQRQIFTAECERINTAARCGEARRGSPVPQLCGPV